MRALSCAVSCNPGNWTRMRSEPCRTTDASEVPSVSMRRRTVSMEAPTALVIRCCKPASVGCSIMSPGSLPRWTERSSPTLPSRALPIGWMRLRSSLIAASTWSGCAILTTTAPPCTPSPVNPMRASRSRLRASSRMLSSQSLRTSLVSMASRRCAPPRRSRPRLSWRFGNQSGQASTVSFEKRFGSARTMPIRQVSTTPKIFQLWKWSM